MANLILIGFSYTGKTSVGRAIARKLGWTFVDTDDVIVQLEGRPIDDIFSASGEPYFRDVERRALVQACDGDQRVVATGGGAVIDPRNRQLMSESGIVVLLESSAEMIHARQERSQRRRGVKRPLLAGDDSLERVVDLKAGRQAYYAIADWTVHTDDMPLGRVVQEVLRGKRIVEDSRARGQQPTARRPRASDASYTVSTGSQRYHGYVGWGNLDELGRRMAEAGLAGAAYVIADAAVFEHYGTRVESSLQGAGFAVDRYLLTPGEAAKTLATAEAIYGWLAERRAERKHVIVALGGGVAGDLGGFVAATYLRGMPFVQAPTTLLSMVDASIGGKVAVNLPAGKNLVGAFYQPRLVLADVETLTTLPPRELTSGWAEVIKHALILDRVLFHNIDAMRVDLLSLEPRLATETIKRSAAIKAGVVSRDEKETGGPRSLLNYGHTIGHALEAALDYGRLLHGEAVAIGMTAAADIACQIGLLSEAAVAQQRDMLEAFGLPLRAPEVRADAVRQAMMLDKKVANGRINWVLLDDIGHAVTRNDVPAEVVDRALAAALP